ncbi:MAG: ROK family protein [Actinomycetota bacterium]|nr:ROK family protein [Actinomycetota bacterium]
MTSAEAPAAGPPTAAPSPPTTLAIDIGGSGLKASVLDARGAMVVDRVRVPTTYPIPPEKLVAALVELVRPLPPFDRVSVGFPGVVRKGRILTAHNLVTVAGPGSEVLPELVEAWTGFDLAAELSERLQRPTKVVNDADMQGAAVVRGDGLELVITLGTGFGTGLFLDGRLAPHLELAHHPLRNDRTYEEELGDVARREVGSKKWNKRVQFAIRTLHALLNYDHLYVGGGNAKHLTIDLGPDATVVPNAAGILGGIKLWDPDAPLGA